MSDALEMARCVRVNLENMVIIMPTLKMHPLLPIVQMQIKECIAALEAAEESVQLTAAGRAENDVVAESGGN